MQKYMSDYEGKEAFVNGPLSQLVYQANTGWGGCVYRRDKATGEEYVYLISYAGYESHGICVSGDSCQAIVSDVFKNL